MRGGTPSIPPRGGTVSQLRDAIDSGRTGEKVRWPDPAAAPLGTDEEAAGTPLAFGAVTQAQAIETSRSSQSDPEPSWSGAVWIMILFVVFLGTGFVGWAAAVIAVR
jgi:hypothetical protein